MGLVFWDTFIVYIVLMIVGVFLFEEQMLLLYLWIALLTVLCILLNVYRQRKKYRLLDDCQPRAFIAWAEKAQPRIRNKALRESHCAFVFMACRDLGDFGQARQWMQKMQRDFSNNRNGRVLEYNYRLMCFYAHLDNQDFASANLELQALENLLQSQQLRSADRQVLEPSILGLKMEYRVGQGDFEGVEAYFLGQLETAKALRQRVYAQYLLARIYQQEGRPEEMQRACQYVIANGGQTCFVAAAKAMAEGQ